jgi:hypothetical protein
LGKVSQQWKALEHTAAKKLGGTRLTRGNDFSQTLLDVEHPFLACDAKWRSSLATVKWFKKLRKDNEKIYGKGKKIPILIIKEKGMRGELIVVDIGDFVKLVNDPKYIITPSQDIDDED